MRIKFKFKNELSEKMTKQAKNNHLEPQKNFDTTFAIDSIKRFGFSPTSVLGSTVSDFTEVRRRFKRCWVFKCRFECSSFSSCRLRTIRLSSFSLQRQVLQGRTHVCVKRQEQILKLSRRFCVENTNLKFSKQFSSCFNLL